MHSDCDHPAAMFNDSQLSAWNTLLKHSHNITGSQAAATLKTYGTYAHAQQACTTQGNPLLGLPYRFHLVHPMHTDTLLRQSKK